MTRAQLREKLSHYQKNGTFCARAIISGYSFGAGWVIRC